MLRGVISGTSRLLRRFVPPWERDGECGSPQDFYDRFSGNNPYTRRKKDRQRDKASQEAAEVQEAQERLEREARTAILAEQLRQREAEQEAARQFLPYGAKPKKYFQADSMAAWGEYQSILSHSGTSLYSAETTQLLQNDLNAKLPYKHESVPPRSGGGAVFPLHGTAGLVLDIDGVVYRSKEIIEGSDEAIRQLVKLKIPFVLMTNGGGMTEAKRAADLSALLDCPIAPEQVILCHTPMSLLAERFKDQEVLIVGPPNCESIAKGYGFQGAKSMVQFQAEHPELVPLKRWSREGPITPLPKKSVPFPEIGGLFVFSDMDDVFSDVQVMVDVLTSPMGRIGGAVSGVQSVPLFMSADDLLWAASAPLPRLGHGAFREMLASVFESVTGKSLHVTQYGKPRAIAYAFAEKRLKEVSAKLGWNPDDLRCIAMIGDNLETDVLGANARGGPWMSVQVMSGIGSAPSARRTLSDGDDEAEWLAEHVDPTPHYIAPTLDHFLREMLAFPESVIVQNKKQRFGPLCPVSLKDVYNFS